MKKILTILGIVTAILGIVTWVGSTLFVPKAEYAAHIAWAEERNKVLVDTYFLAKGSNQKLDSLLWEICWLRRELKR